MEPAKPASKSYLKDRQLRLFASVCKNTGREPDMSGTLLLDSTLYYIGVWKNKSRKTGEDFYKGLLHLDGERGKNTGTISLYKNKFYIEGVQKLPIVYGRLKLNGTEFKVHLWKKERENKKPFYSGIVRNLI